MAALLGRLTGETGEPRTAHVFVELAQQLLS